MKDTSRMVNCFGPVWVVPAVLLLPFLRLPSECRGATYYVDGNSPAARDSNAGTEAQPWRTIGRAASSVQPGDMVCVKTGIYRETVILTKSGTAAQPITIQAYPGHEAKAIINAAQPVITWQKCAGPNDCGGNPQGILGTPYLFR